MKGLPMRQPFFGLRLWGIVWGPQVSDRIISRLWIAFSGPKAGIRFDKLRTGSRLRFAQKTRWSVFGNCADRNSVGLPPIPQENAEWMGHSFAVSHPSRKNKGAARVGHPGAQLRGFPPWSVFGNCADRNSVGLPPIPQENAEWMGHSFVVSHPSRKNKGAARVGHPGAQLRGFPP
jgi:hypothetical protein